MDSNKVLFLGSYPPPFGGIASHLSDMQEVTKRKNRSFFVFDPVKVNLHKSEGMVFLRSPKRWWSAIISPSYLYYIVRHLRPFLSVWFSARKFSRSGKFGRFFTLRTIVTLIDLIETCDEFEINTISAYHTFPDALYPYLIKLYFKPALKYAVTVFGELQANTIQIERFGGEYKTILQAADLLMASSQYCARGVEHIGLSEKNVIVVPYGIDLEHFRRTVDYDKGRGEQSILFVGHINERMGLECLLNAVSELRETRKQRVLAHIVGNDHGYLTTFKKLISEKKLEDCVALHFNVSYKELKDFYNSSYVYVNTANTKVACMGLSMKEAMAAELPVIASNAGGIPEAVEEGRTGFIFHVDDFRELATLIGKFLDDFGMAKKFGQQGRRRAEEIFDRNKSSEKILQLLDTL